MSDRELTLNTFTDIVEEYQMGLLSRYEYQQGLRFVRNILRERRVIFIKIRTYKPQINL